MIRARSAHSVFSLDFHMSVKGAAAGRGEDRAKPTEVAENALQLLVAQSPARLLASPLFRALDVGQPKAGYGTLLRP